MTNEQGYALLKQVQEIAKPCGYVIFQDGRFRMQITDWSRLRNCNGNHKKQKEAYEEYVECVKEYMDEFLEDENLDIDLKVLGWNGKLVLDGHTIGFGYPFPAPVFEHREQLFNVKEAALYITANYGEISPGTIYKQLENDVMKGHKVIVGSNTRWKIPQGSLDHYGENNLGQPGNPHLIKTGKVK